MTHRLLSVGNGKYCIVDAVDFLWLRRYHWKARKSKYCFYATRKIKTENGYRYIKMHREILNAPKGTHVHHKNHNPLDNRRCNLEIMNPKIHHIVHNSRGHP